MKTHLPCGVLVLCASVCAQAPFVTTPKGYLGMEGGHFANLFGAYAAGRWQAIDGEYRGTALALKEISFRLDYFDHTPLTAMGRKWSAVTIDASDGDVGATVGTFISNPKSTPNRVFSGNMTWPTQKGFPLLRPALWGTVLGSLRFPFSNTWLSLGTKDILLDYDFTGGTLANNGTWAMNHVRLYQLDGYGDGPYNAGSQILYGLGGPGAGCRDGGNAAQGAFANFFSYTYSRTHPSKNLQGKHEFAFESFYTAPGRPVIHAVSLGGSAQGIAIPGVACNRLHINLATSFQFGQVAGNSPRAGASTKLPLFPYTPVAVGISATFQAAWGDSKGGGLKLSRAASNFIMPIPSNSVKRVAVYTNDPKQKGAKGVGPNDAAYVSPITRYKR